MLHTYEATLDTNGQVWFTDASKPPIQQRQKVLITIVSPVLDAVFGKKNNPAHTQANSISQIEAKPDWQAFAGLLKNTTAFAGDPLAVQHQLRSEWH